MSRERAGNNIHKLIYLRGTEYLYPESKQKCSWQIDRGIILSFALNNINHRVSSIGTAPEYPLPWQMINYVH